MPMQARPDPMHTAKPPSEIAREALKLLAVRKLSPTPANYQDCYCEIAQTPHLQNFPEDQLRHIALSLTARNKAQAGALEQLALAIRRFSWEAVGNALVEFVRLGGESGEGPATASGQVVGEAAGSARWSALPRLAELIRCVQPALTGDDPDFAEQCAGMLQTLKAPQEQVPTMDLELGLFNRRMCFAAEEQTEVRKTLLRLLHIVIENIGILLLNDKWLEGQVALLLDAIHPPLSLRRLDDVERRIREVIDKQSAAQTRSVEAQAEIREMLGTFIQRLSSMHASSAGFQGQLEHSVQQLEGIHTLEDLAPLLKEVIAATRAMAEDTAHTREELRSLQEQVMATEAEITKLHMELDTASAMARHDHLTNTLNRKGLDEVMLREIAALRRKGSSLSIALLDVDNFKKLNDRLGHKMGDAALVHLVRVVRACMRPSDALARYGGEEFVILMPDTPLEEAITVMTRLQRELTRNFFMADNEKILITFSAGVVQLQPEEFQEEALRRADAAMYLAKRAGKNRVLMG